MVIDEIEFELKDGRKALLRSPGEEDIEGMLELLVISAGETEFVMRYPEECGKYTPESERALFEQKNASEYGAMMVCLVEGRIAGSCEIVFNEWIKTKHRAGIAIAVIREFWNQGIGTRMLQELIGLAEKKTDVIQMELEFVEGNARARRLYEKMGFKITGVRPDAIRLKDGRLLNEYMMVRKMER